MLTIDGSALRIDDVVGVARHGEQVEVDGAVRQRIAESRSVVDRIDAEGAAVYGVTTGFGALADRAIARTDRNTLQRAVVLSHAAGIGEALPAEVVRGAILLRARTLAAGLSGVRVELVHALMQLLEHGVVPWVPEH